MHRFFVVARRVQDRALHRVHPRPRRRINEAAKPNKEAGSSETGGTKAPNFSAAQLRQRGSSSPPPASFHPAGAGPWRLRSCTAAPPKAKRPVRRASLPLPSPPDCSYSLLLPRSLPPGRVPNGDRAPARVCAGEKALMRAARDGNLGVLKGR
jgi:hypothetical protein